METKDILLKFLLFAIFFVLLFPIFYSSFRFTQDKEKSKTEKSESFKFWVRFVWLISLFVVSGSVMYGIYKV